MEVTGLDNVRSLDHPARSGQDQAHGEVGGIFGKHPRRIGDNDPTRVGGGHVDMVDADTEVGDQRQLRTGPGDQIAVQPVGDRARQNLRPRECCGKGLDIHRRVVEIELSVEKLTHAGFNRIRELSRYDNFRLAKGHGSV